MRIERIEVRRYSFPLDPPFHAAWDPVPRTRAEAIDVVQPDAVLAVGLLRAAEVAREAQARGASFTPHTWTNGIGLLANLHLSAAAGAAPFVELPYDPPGWTPERRDWMLAGPLHPDGGGRIAVPPGPGLGIVLDDERLEAHRIG